MKINYIIKILLIENVNKKMITLNCKKKVVIILDNSIIKKINLRNNNTMYHISAI